MRGGEEGLLNGNTAAMSRRRDAPVFCYGLLLGPFSKSLIFYQRNKRNSHSLRELWAVISLTAT